MRNEELAIQVRAKAAGLKFLGDIVKMFVVARKGMDKIYVARHPSVSVRRQLPFQGSLWAAALDASPVRGYGAERRLRRRKLFLVWQTAVTPFIIACSAIENIRPPFAHRSGLYRFAVMQRSQNASVLQRTRRDAGTANRTVDAPQGADGGVHCRLAAKMSCKARQDLALCFVGDDACIVSEALRCRKAPRRAKSPALHCGRKWALTCKRQPAARPAGGPMQASAPTQGGRPARETAQRRDTACRPRSRRPPCKAPASGRRQINISPPAGPAQTSPKKVFHTIPRPVLFLPLFHYSIHFLRPCTVILFNSPSRKSDRRWWRCCCT